MASAMTHATVRRAVPADLEVVLTMTREFHAEEGDPYDEAQVRTALEPLLADDAHGQVWLLTHRVDGGLGYAVLTWGWGLESGGREGLLDELFVADGWRHEGLGGLLLERVIAEARSASCRTLFLETELANDRARALYARHGLEQQDSIWMSCRLA
jgi:GNAT superfamily N-acetyltransferase